MQDTEEKRTAPGIISRDASYTVREFCRRTGLGRYALTQARRAGLKVRASGQNRFILGSDWLDYLASLDEPLPRRSKAEVDPQQN